MLVSVNFGRNIERRREILYGTPGTMIYRDGKPILWIPDNFGTITRELSQKDIEAIQRELMKYLKSENSDENIN